LQLNKVNGTNLNTTIIGYQLTPAFVKKLIRKRSNRLDDHFNLKTKGGKEIILKSLIITLHKVQRSVKTRLRKELKNLLEEEISKTGFDIFVTNLVNQKIQSGIKKKFHKICPIRNFSVRVLKLKRKGLVEEEIIVEDTTKKEKVAEEKEPNTEEKTE